MGVRDALVVAAALVVSLALYFLIVVPLLGTLVRFRANYSPKGLQLDGEGGVQPHTGPVVNSYFAMFMRVKRLEGWSGFYKGLTPILLVSIVTMVFVLLLPNTSFNRNVGHKKYAVPVEGVWNRLVYSLFLSAISLPATIVINRSITTPYKLPWFNAVYSLRVLLTPVERKRPWILFLTPGLLVSEVLQVIYVVLFMDPLRAMIIPPPDPSDGKYTFKSVSLQRFSLYVLLAVISTVVLCALEVISTRLSIQRNHEGSGLPAVVQDEQTENNDVAYSASEEDVIGLRSDDDPYVGFVDCAKRIVNEEGYRTLFRAWWLVLLPLLVIPFVP